MAQAIGTMGPARLDVEPPVSLPTSQKTFPTHSSNSSTDRSPLCKDRTNKQYVEQQFPSSNGRKDTYGQIARVIAQATDLLYRVNTYTSSIYIVMILPAELRLLIWTTLFRSLKLELYV